MSPILGIWASQISGHLWAPAGAYDALATVTLSASASSITFAGIPTGYKHLQLRYMAKGSSGSGGYPTGAYLSFNGDTTNGNYFGHYLRGDGSSASAGSALSARNNLVFAPGSSGSWSSTSLFGVGIIDILDYSSTSKNKTIRSLSGADANGAGAVGLMSTAWANSTTAINSITIDADATYQTNFIQNSQFALYGIK